jgi:hypothetical protein
MASSFVEKGNWQSDNLILSEDNEESDKLGVISHPQVVINDFSYRGDLYGRDIFYALCSAFRDKQP